MGEDFTVRELAVAIARVVSLEGNSIFDPSKPDGTPRKLLDVARLRVVWWKEAVAMGDGIRSAYDGYVR